MDDIKHVVKKRYVFEIQFESKQQVLDHLDYPSFDAMTKKHGFLIDFLCSNAKSLNDTSMDKTKSVVGENYVFQNGGESLFLAYLRIL